VNGTSLAW